MKEKFKIGDKVFVKLGRDIRRGEVSDIWKNKQGTLFYKIYNCYFYFPESLMAYKEEDLLKEN